MAMLQTVITVFRAVVTLFLTGLPGFAAGFEGVIDQRFLQSLAHFQLSFLSPALIFSTLGMRLSAERLAALWPLVLWSCAQMAVGLAAGTALPALVGLGGKDGKTTGTYQSLLQLTLLFQNIGIFNYPLLKVLCKTGRLFQGEAQQCYEDGVLMIFIYKLPWDLVLWSWGYSKLMSLGKTQAQANGKGSTNGGPSVEGARQQAKSEDAHGAGALAPVRPLQRAWALVLSAVRSCNCNLAAMLLGVMVGLTPPLRALLFGPTATLGSLGDALKDTGVLAPALGLQILSGTLGCTLREFRATAGSARSAGIPHRGSRADAAVPPPGRQAPHADGKCPSGPDLQGKWLVAVLVGKLLVLPAVGFLAFIFLSSVEGWSAGGTATCTSSGERAALFSEDLAVPEWSRIAPWAAATQRLWPQDRLFRTMLMMQWSAPSFLNLVVLCHRAALETATVQAIALLYLLLYSLTPLSTTLWVGISMAVF